MVISDTTKITTREHVYQVNSSKSYIIYYSINRDKNTSPVFVSCQIADDLYKPRVKMRTWNATYVQVGVIFNPIKGKMDMDLNAWTNNVAAASQHTFTPCMYSRVSLQNGAASDFNARSGF